jgi:hypothetical protein
MPARLRILTDDHKGRPYILDERFKMKNILFISNGHGEDLVAQKLISLLAKDYNCTFFPLIKELPSGGFSLRNFNFLIKDLAAGLFGHTVSSFLQLKKLKGQFDLVVAIGDIVPLIGARLVGAPIIFVGVNKSSYYQSFGAKYTPWEKWLLKRVRKVFVRDRETLKDLPFSEYTGNPLMDCVGIMKNASHRVLDISSARGEKFKMKNEGLFTIGLLPGTRSDASLNLADFQKVAEELVKIKKPSDCSLKFLIATTITPLPDFVEQKSFAALLSQSDLIIGLSGTGNEQAAGLGVPVVSFYGRGSQYNSRFAKAQKELLGDALSLIPGSNPISVAAEVWALLRHPQKRAYMGQIGRERMGETGALAKIADYIRKTLV